MAKLGIKIEYPNGDLRRFLAAKQRAVLEGTRRGVLETVIAAEGDAKQNLTKAGRVDRGITRASIGHVVNEPIPGVYEGVVFVGAFWGIWIENGRRGRKRNPKGINARSATAAFPPLKVLVEWVQRHYKSFAPGGRTRGGRARARSTKRGEAGRVARSRYDRRLYQLAFLVGRKIRDYGIPPTPFMLPAFRKQAPLLQRRINFWIKRLSP